MSRIFSLFLFLLLLSSPLAANAEKITVVTSFSILGDMVGQIAGDKVNSITLVGANSDAHVYEPTPADAKTISQANLVIMNGLGFEGWIDRLIKASNYKGDVVTASEDVVPIMVNNSPDPHAWQDISNGKLYVINILSALSKADPQNAVTYSNNAANYLKTLSAVDEWTHAAIEKVPMEKRSAITSHDALRYFAHAYNVQFISPLGNSTNGEASARYIAQLIDLMRRKQVRAVFLENMTDSRQVKQLITDGDGILGGTLYTDALSDSAGPAPTYTEMFRHNVTLLVQAMAQN